MSQPLMLNVLLSIFIFKNLILFVLVVPILSFCGYVLIAALCLAKVIAEHFHLPLCLLYSPYAIDRLQMQWSQAGQDP